jgi:uncharacterized membrane protein
MNKQVRWLMAEIDHWKAEGLVSPEQAGRLRQRYAEPASSTPWALLVFASAGSVVIGLGVILLFAYNWADIPKFGKLALILGAVIAAHAGGLRCRRHTDWRAPLGAVLHLLGTMFYGAGIWLVAQIYHIEEHFPNGFLLWGLGALVLAWALDSVLQGLLATVLLAIWGGSEVLAFREPHYWALPLVAAGIAPLAWRRQSGALLCFVLIAVQFLLMANLASFGTGAHVFTSSFALGACWIAVARLNAASNPAFAGGTRVLNFFGYAGFILCSYLLSFGWLGRYVFNWDRQTVQPGYETAMLYNWGLFALAIAGWLIVAVRSFLYRSQRTPGEEWLVPVAVAYCYALVWGRYLTQFGVRPFNLILLGLAAMWMWRGSREGRLRETVLGLLLLSGVVLARYFDLFQSLAARGLAFVVLGGVLLSVVFLHRRKARPAPAAPEGTP